MHRLSWMKNSIHYNCSTEPLDNTDALLGSKHKFLVSVVMVSTPCIHLSLPLKFLSFCPVISHSSSLYFPLFELSAQQRWRKGELFISIYQEMVQSSVNLFGLISCKYNRHFYIRNLDFSQLLSCPPTAPAGNFVGAGKEPTFNAAWPGAPEGGLRWPGVGICLC